MWFIDVPSKLKASFVITSNLAVAGTCPSFFNMIYKYLSLPILVLRNLSIGVPSASNSSGLATYKVGSVPSPLISKLILPCLGLSSPFYTIASNTPPYYFISVGVK